VGRPALPVPRLNLLAGAGAEVGGVGSVSAKRVISRRFACASTGLAEIGFAEVAGLTIRSPRLSGCVESISSPALWLDSRLLRCLAVRGSALVGMGDGTVIIAASLLGPVSVQFLGFSRVDCRGAIDICDRGHNRS
jgi:hypothetical protein